MRKKKIGSRLQRKILLFCYQNDKEVYKYIYHSSREQWYVKKLISQLIATNQDN